MPGLDNPLHIAFLLVVMLLVFGARRLPEMGRSLGGGMRGFKESLNGEVGHQELMPAPSAVRPASPTSPSDAEVAAEASEATAAR